MLARTLQACVWDQLSPRYTGLCRRVCQKFLLLREIEKEWKLSNRWGQLPKRTWQVRLARVRVPLYAMKAYRQWFGNAGNGKKAVCESTRDRFLISKQLLGRTRRKYSFVEAMHHLPCLRMDTVNQTDKPKESLSVCLWDHSSFWPQVVYEQLQTVFWPSGGITYNEKDYC